MYAQRRVRCLSYLVRIPLVLTSSSMYHLELDLSQTGIHTLEDQVPLPYFHGSESNYGSPSDEKSHFQYHFLAMIALRRLVARIHESIHCCKCLL
jgi:hypothetical protein